MEQGIISCQHTCECSTAKVIIKLTFNNTRLSIKANPCENSFTWFSIGSYSTDTNLVWYNNYWLFTVHCSTKDMSAIIKVEFLTICNDIIKSNTTYGNENQGKVLGFVVLFCLNWTVSKKNSSKHLSCL